jgi:hypothetical protein
MVLHLDVGDEGVRAALAALAGLAPGRVG